MRGIRRIVWSGLLAALVLGARAQAADDPVHFCQDDEGNVVAQKAPCDDGTLRKDTLDDSTRVPPLRATPGERRASPRVAARAAPSPPRRRPIARGPVDPRFATPESTWKTFTEAVRSGDRATALACLTPSALPNLEADPGTIALDDLRRSVESVTRIHDEGDLGSFWSFRATRRSGRPTWIFLEQTDEGHWKIAAM